MSCTEKAAKSISNDCNFLPRAGLEKVAYAINREDIELVTYDGTIENLVTAIDLNSGTVAYPVTAVKKEGNAGFDLEVGDDIPDTYLNYFAFKPYENDAESIQNIDQMQDLVVIAELKGAKTEGCFVIYGLEKGLYKNSGTQRQLDNHGLPIYEFNSQEGQGERYSRFIFWDTDYATTVAALETLVSGYGPELHTDANAASDPYGNEADAITGWTDEVSGPGANVFESQGVEVNEGSYAFHADCNDTPTPSSRFRKTFVTEPGESYYITFDWRHVGSGGDWEYHPDYQVGETVTITNAETAWTSVQSTVVASGATMVIQFREASGTNDGGVYVDNFSMRKVL